MFPDCLHVLAYAVLEGAEQLVLAVQFLAHFPQVPQALLAQFLLHVRGLVFQDGDVFARALEAYLELLQLLRLVSLTACLVFVASFCVG